MKDPFYISRDKGKPQKVIFTCNCRTLRDARELRVEVNIKIREMGYVKNKDFKCKILKVTDDNK